MKLLDLFEARRNADHPAQKETRKSVIDTMLKYDGVEGVYVSFTDLPKAGLNPKSDFNTPIGIYCYPLQYYINIVKDRKSIGLPLSDVDFQKLFPFASKRPFIMVIKEKEPLKDVSDYSQDDWERDSKKLIQLFDQKTFDGIIKYSEYYNDIDYNKMKPINKFWSWCFTYSLLPNRDLPEYISYLQDPSNDIIKSRSNTLRWSLLLLKLGYTGFSDKKGIGRIHKNEPLQAFFIKSSFFDLVERVQQVDDPASSSTYANKMKITQPLSEFNKNVLNMVKKKLKQGVPSLIQFYVDQGISSLWTLEHLPPKLITVDLISALMDKFGYYSINSHLGSKLTPELISSIIDMTNSNNKKVAFNAASILDELPVQKVPVDKIINISPEYYTTIARLAKRVSNLKLLPNNIMFSLLDKYPNLIESLHPNLSSDMLIKYFQLLENSGILNSYDIGKKLYFVLDNPETRQKFKFIKWVIDTERYNTYKDSLGMDYITFDPKVHRYFVKKNFKDYVHNMDWDYNSPTDVKEYVKNNINNQNK